MSTEHYIEPSDVNLGDRLAVQWTGHNGGWTTVDITDQESIDALDNANRIVFLEHARLPWPTDECIYITSGETGGGVPITGYAFRTECGNYRTAAEHQEPPNADDPTDAEVRAAAVEFEQHEQFWYDDDDQPRCECGFRLEESPNGDPIPSLQIHQARAGLLAARKVARHE